MNQRPLGYEDNAGRDGRQTQPTDSIRDRRLQAARLGWVGAGWRRFTDNSRTRAVGFLHVSPRTRTACSSTTHSRRVTTSVARRGSIRLIAARMRALSCFVTLRTMIPEYSSGGVGPDVPEVHVERDEDAPFPPHHLTEARVVDARETLARRRGCLVASVTKRCGDVFGEVLVDLEREGAIRHYAAPGTSGMTRSRARSAAYAIAAWTSPGRRVG